MHEKMSRKGGQSKKVATSYKGHRSYLENTGPFVSEEWKLIFKDCQCEAELNSIEFEDCEVAVGPMFAGQCALRCFVDDEENLLNDRCDAMVLFAWIGSLEASIDEVVNLSPWAGELILECLKKYGPVFPNDSNFLINFGDAIDSLEYQLEQYYIESPVDVVQSSELILD